MHQSKFWAWLTVKSSFLPWLGSTSSRLIIVWEAGIISWTLFSPTLLTTLLSLSLVLFSNKVFHVNAHGRVTFPVTEWKWIYSFGQYIANGKWHELLIFTWQIIYWLMKNPLRCPFLLDVINATFKTIMVSSEQTLCSHPLVPLTNKENVMGKRNKPSRIIEILELIFIQGEPNLFWQKLMYFNNNTHTHTHTRARAHAHTRRHLKHWFRDRVTSYGKAGI